MHMTRDGCYFVRCCLDWLPKEMNALPGIHIPIDEIMQFHFRGRATANGTRRWIEEIVFGPKCNSIAWPRTTWIRWIYFCIRKIFFGGHSQQQCYLNKASSVLCSDCSLALRKSILNTVFGRPSALFGYSHRGWASTISSANSDDCCEKITFVIHWFIDRKLVWTGLNCSYLNNTIEDSQIERFAYAEWSEYFMQVQKLHWHRPNCGRLW